MCSFVPIIRQYVKRRKNFGISLHILSIIWIEFNTPYCKKMGSEWFKNMLLRLVSNNFLSDLVNSFWDVNDLKDILESYMLWLIQYLRINWLLKCILLNIIKIRMNSSFTVFASWIHIIQRLYRYNWLFCPSRPKLSSWSESDVSPCRRFSPISPRHQSKLPHSSQVSLIWDILSFFTFFCAGL